MKKILYICMLMFAVPCMADENIIDEVIWIVGDEAILRSEVEEERRDRRELAENVRNR